MPEYSVRSNIKGAYFAPFIALALIRTNSASALGLTKTFYFMLHGYTSIENLIFGVSFNRPLLFYKEKYKMRQQYTAPTYGGNRHRS